MDALDFLKTDHERLRRLFRQFQTESSDQRRFQVFRQIRADLLTLLYIEESVFYPPFGRYDEFQPMIARYQHTHAEIKRQLDEIVAHKPRSEELASKIETLKEAVERQLSEEEHELFAGVRKLMKRPERDQLGRHLEAAKKERQSEAA
jgi:Hemerythrin HHE cation binding domain